MMAKRISKLLVFLIILGIFVSSVMVFASGIAVGNTNQEIGDKKPELYITEVFYDTPGVDSKEEWVELYNPTNSDIDISGLFLRDNSNSWNLPFSTVINARSTIIIARNKTGFRNLYDVDPEVSGMTLGLNNDGDILRLMEGNVTAINDPDTKEGHTIIVEVYPNTYLFGDTAGEFVRIHNPTENSINLGGWQITDLIKGSKITFPEWANISAGDSLYLAYNDPYFMTRCFSGLILSMVMIPIEHQIWIKVDGV